MKPTIFLIIAVILMYLIITGKAQQLWALLNA